jgi:hypothetical protein
MTRYRLVVEASFLLSVAFVTACSGSVTPVAPQTSAPAHRYVKHIVIVIQENRSFDNLFSGFPGTDAPVFGYAGTRRLPLRATPLENPGSIENNWRDAVGGPHVSNRVRSQLHGPLELDCG